MDFQSILNEIQQFQKNPQSIGLLSDEKERLHSLGFDQMKELCFYAVQNKASSFVIYILFTVLSSLLGPNLPSNILDQIIQELISLPITTFEYTSQLAISRCIATAIFHSLSPETYQSIISFLQPFPQPLLLNILSEYLLILREAHDIPFFANSIFISLTQIFPVFFDFIITSYLEISSQQLDDLFLSLTSFYNQPSLQSLISSLKINFNIEDLLESIFSKFYVFLPTIIESWQTKQYKNQQKDHFISFITNSIDLISNVHSFQKEKSLEIINTVLNLLLNPEFNSFTNITPLFNLISTILKKRLEGWEVPNIIIQFLNAVSDIVSQFDENNLSLELLNDCLNLMTEITLFISNDDLETSSPFLPIIPEIISRQLQCYGNPNNSESILISEETDQFLENIVENEIFLIKTDISDTFQMLSQFFTTEISPSQCYIILCILNQWGYILTEDDRIDSSQKESLYQALCSILQTEEMMKYADASIQVTQEMLHSYDLLYKLLTRIPAYDDKNSEEYHQISAQLEHTKEAAQTSFHFAIERYGNSEAFQHYISSNDNNYKKLYDIIFDLTDTFKFSLDSISEQAQVADITAMIQPKSLTKLVSKEHSVIGESSFQKTQSIQSTLQNTMEFLQSNDSNTIAQGAAILIGLIQAMNSNSLNFSEININFAEFIPVLLENHLFSEAIKITTSSSEQNKNLTIQVIQEIHAYFSSISEKTGNLEDEYDDLEKIFHSALKAAQKTTYSPLTEIALSLIEFFPVNIFSLKSWRLIADLFSAHKKDKVELTEVSLKILVDLFLSMAQNHLYLPQVNPRLLSVISSYFQDLNELLTDDFWIIAFNYMLNYGGIDEGSFFSQFFITEPERFYALFVPIIQSTIPIDLIQTIYISSFNQTFFDIVKTYRYFKKFQ